MVSLIYVSIVLAFGLAKGNRNIFRHGMLEDHTKNVSFTNISTTTPVNFNVNENSDHSDPNDSENNNYNFTSSYGDTNGTILSSPTQLSNDSNVTKVETTTLPGVDTPVVLVPSKSGQVPHDIQHEQSLGTVYRILIYCSFIICVTIMKVLYSKVTILKNKLNEST